MSFGQERATSNERRLTEEQGQKRRVGSGGIVNRERARAENGNQLKVQG
jgi:hypothetical protein